MANNKTNETKNCHYVQQSYLKNFSSDTKKKRIWEFSKQNCEPENRKILNVAKEDFFYPQWLEEWFQKNPETFGIKSLNKIAITQEINDLKKQEKQNIVEWLIIQNERTLERRNSMIQGHNELYKKLQEEDSTIKSNTEYIPQMQINHIFKYQELNPFILKYKWFLLINQNSIPLFTSDHPVILHNPNDDINNANHFTRNGTGYLSNGVGIYAPINPKIALLLQNCNLPNLFHLKGSKSIIELDEENVKYYNSKMVFHSNMYLFSNQSNFSSVLDVLDQNPEYREENRKRWDII